MGVTPNICGGRPDPASRLAGLGTGAAPAPVPAKRGAPALALPNPASRLAGSGLPPHILGVTPHILGVFLLIIIRFSIFLEVFSLEHVPKFQGRVFSEKKRPLPGNRGLSSEWVFTKIHSNPRFSPSTRKSTPPKMMPLTISIEWDHPNPFFFSKIIHFVGNGSKTN